MINMWATFFISLIYKLPIKYLESYIKECVVNVKKMSLSFGDFNGGVRTILRFVNKITIIPSEQV